MKKILLIWLTLCLSAPAFCMDKWQQFNDTVVALYRKQSYNEAIPYAQKALKLATTSKGKHHPLTLTSMNNLAKLYQLTGQLDQAEKLFNKSFKLRKKVLGETHKETLISHNNLIQLYMAKKQFDLASELTFKQLRLNIKRSATIEINLKSVEILSEIHYAQVNALLNTNQPQIETLVKEQTAEEEIATLKAELAKTKEKLAVSKSASVQQQEVKKAPIEDLSATVDSLKDKIAAIKMVHDAEIMAYSEQSEHLEAQVKELKSATDKNSYRAQEKLLEKVTQCQEERVQLKKQLMAKKNSE